MTKQKKKRTKAYQGGNSSRPTVTRIQATNRNAVQQWWFEKKRLTKPIAIAAGVAVVILWLLYELLRAISGSIA